MDAYLDLSYLFHLCIIFTLPYYLRRIANIRIKKLDIFSLCIFSIVLYFNVFLFESYFYLNYVYVFIYFFFLYRKKSFKYFLIFWFVYYGNLATMMIFTNDIYLLKGIVFLNRPRAFLYIFLELMNIVLIELIFLSIRSIKLLRNYKTKVKIEIDESIIEVDGYIDSGNTLLIDDLPVVFLSEEYFKKKGYKEVLVKGIGYKSCKIFKTFIEINERKKKVIVASGDKNGYKGCQCLINIHLMEGNDDEIIK